MQPPKRQNSEMLVRAPAYNRLENALLNQDLEALVAKAKAFKVEDIQNPRCFCINAIVEWDHNRKAKILHTFTLLKDDQWSKPLRKF